MNHYLVKESDKIPVIFKRYEKLDEAVNHCLIYARANEGKPVFWWTLSTEKVLPDGHTVDLGN